MKINYRTKIGTLLHNGTYGSVLYIDTNKKLAEDNSNLFWDDVNKRLGIGTTTPSYELDLEGGNLGLDNTTFANQKGVVNKNGTRFIHDFNYGNNGTVTTLGENTFIGRDSGNFTMGSTAVASFQASFNTALGAVTLYSNTTGNSNMAIGYYALYANTTGGNNAAIGANSLLSNTTGNGNAANGQSSLRENIGGYWNTANGNDAGRYISNGDGNTNSNTSIFIGHDSRPLDDSQGNQIVIGAYGRGKGSNTVVIGDTNIVGTYLRGGVNIDEFTASTIGLKIEGAVSQSADLLQILDSSSTKLTYIDFGGKFYSSLGTSSTNFFAAGAGNTTLTGTNNFGVGNNNFLSGTTCSGNLFFGNNIGVYITTGENNVGFGFGTLFDIDDGSENLAAGTSALSNCVSGSYNVSLGSNSLIQATGSYNTGIGSYSGNQIQSGTNNALCGYGTMSLVNGASSNNSALGFEAGKGSATAVSGCVYLGYQAGYSNSTSNRLFIDNSNTATPLIYGEFDNDILSIYGDLKIPSDSKKIFVGAGDDASFSYDGTNGHIQTSHVAASDLDVTCGANKTIELQNPVYEDLVLPLDFTFLPAANAPNRESFVGNLTGLAYDIDDYQEFTTELVHGYQEGSTFEFHVHCALNATVGGTDETVKFEIEYTVANMDATDGIGDVFPSTTTISAELTVPAATPDLTNIYLSIGSDTTGTFGIGATIKGRIRRIASSGTELAGDPFVTQVGIHYLVNTMGSRQITVK